MAAIDQTKLCNIINNSGKDVVIALAVNADETTGPSSLLSANNRLELLTLSSGGTVLKNGSSANVTLDHTYKPGADGSGYVQDYDLVICDSVWLYPLGNLSATQSQGANTGFASQTITGETLTPMSQAISFYQIIAAYPGSQLGKDYIEALQQVQADALSKADGSSGAAAAVAEAITNGITAFFKGTKDYQLVTQANMVAIDNYYNNFPCVWARYENSLTYYLYGGDGTTNIFAGVLSLKKSLALDPSKNNGGYTCLFVPAVNPADNNQTAVDNSKAVTLSYTGGVFVNDIQSGTPSVGLKGSLQLSRLFTNDAEDNNVITIITGTVNGVQCIGLDTAQKDSKATTQSVATIKSLAATSSVSDTIVAYWDVLTHPKSRKDWIVSISTLVGAILVIPAVAGAVYGIYRVVKYKAQQKAMIEKKIVSDRINQMAEDAKATRMKWGQNETQVVPEYGLEMIEAAVDMAEGGCIMQALAMAITFQRYAAEELMTYRTTMSSDQVRDLQEVVTSARQSEVAVTKAFDKVPNIEDKAAFKAGLETLKEQTGLFTENQEAFEAIYRDVAQNISNDARTFIETNVKNCAQIFEQMKETETREEQEETEVEPEVREEIKPIEIIS